jgi:hypothetical protein
MNELKIHSDYDKPWCWQYDIRLRNLEEDKFWSMLSDDEIADLKPTDFDMYLSTDENEHNEMTKFIERHEWLGTISLYTTHWFACRYKGILAGVILMNQPNSFSKLLGDDTSKLERLISRGACISWSPKCLASHFLMFCIKWMVQNTEYRLFTAYSDVEAKEIGQIYSACNFYYLGKNSGGTKKYVNPYNGKLMSDRQFRCRSFYKKYAKELKIEWQKNWNDGDKMLWENIPNDVEQKLRDFSKKKQSESKMVEVPSKHKYAYVLGRNKRETKLLRRKFLELNKVYDYPKREK